MDYYESRCNINNNTVFRKMIMITFVASYMIIFMNSLFIINRSIICLINDC